MVEKRTAAIEYELARQIGYSTTLQLHIEYLEDRSRRGNLPLWGLPETIGLEELKDTVVTIFRRVLEPNPPELLEVD